MTVEAAFGKLARSKFRSRFRLSEADRAYIGKHGLDALRRHAEDFVRQRLAPACPLNDGRQTPMRGHPVFTAQHATATCCRGCLNKGWGVPLGVELSPLRQRKVVNLIMAWIARELPSAWPCAESSSTCRDHPRPPHAPAGNVMG